ncbi:hypothetical protein HK405_007512, partial [Cladochytrium tenue]
MTKRRPSEQTANPATADADAADSRGNRRRGSRRASRKQSRSTLAVDAAMNPSAFSATAKSPKYSVLLPTYNERENLPIITWMLVKAFQDA